MNGDVAPDAGDLYELTAAVVRTLLLAHTADAAETERGIAARQAESQAVQALRENNLLPVHIHVLREARRLHRDALKHALRARETHARVRAALNAAETALYEEN